MLKKIEMIKDRLDEYVETNNLSSLIDAQSMLSQVVRDVQDHIRQYYSTNDYEV